MSTNLNLGAHHDVFIAMMIERGYAASQIEVIRQALLHYQSDLEQRELMAAQKGVEYEKQQMRASRAKPKTLAEMKRKYGL